MTIKRSTIATIPIGVAINNVRGSRANLGGMGKASHAKTHPPMILAKTSKTIPEINMLNLILVLAVIYRRAGLAPPNFFNV